jgi:outer membrane protein assembly factor BamA
MYYGIGNDTPLSQAVKYDPFVATESLKARTRIVGDLELDSSVSFRQQGSIAGGESAAAAAAAVPDLVDPNETLVGASLLYDGRDNRVNPWYGASLALGGDVSTRYLGSTSDFQRAFLDARAYFSPFTHYTLAFRLLCRESFGDTPSFFLPSLGGEEVGRGFAPARFADNLLLASQVELRFPIVWVLKGVVFADVGQVAASWGDLNLQGTHASAGIGLRVFPSPDENTVLAYDLGFSAEGCTFSFRLGHAF